MNTELRQELFFQIMEECMEGQSINESTEYLDEATAIYEALEEFFVENYRHLTIEEQVLAVVRNVDLNEELVDVMVETLLDESIGTAVATAVHAIGQKRAERKAISAQKNLQKKSELAHKAGSLAAKRTLATKQADKANTGSIGGAFKAAFSRARSDKQYGKYLAAKEKKAAASAKNQAAIQQAHAKQQKRADLAQRIDTKVTKAKETVKSGIKKAASFIGRKLGGVL